MKILRSILSFETLDDLSLCLDQIPGGVDLGASYMFALAERDDGSPCVVIVRADFVAGNG